MIILNPGEPIAAMGAGLPGKAPVMPSCGVERTGICKSFKSDGFGLTSSLRHLILTYLKDQLLRREVWEK